MLAHTFHLDEEAAALEGAIGRVLADGVVTRDLARGGAWATTGAFTEAAAAAVRAGGAPAPIRAEAGA